MALDRLFRPFAAGRLTLSNRLVMAPMTRTFSPGGVPGEDVAAYYRRRAEGGVGLIITEGVSIDHPAAVSHAAIPHFFGQEALDGWRRVLREVHGAGGKIFPQLWHVGAARKPGDLPNPDAEPVSPSGLFAPDQPRGRTLSVAEIEAIVQAYAAAAGQAEDMGFDGVELHFAHGYLTDQFFWRPTNTRSDSYGQRRTLFAEEIIRACRQEVGPDFPICVRFSQWKQQEYDARIAEAPQELEAFLAPLADAGVDIFHCSTRRFWAPEFAGSDLNLAGWTKKLTGRATITVGSVGLNEEFLVTRLGSSSDNDRSRLYELESRMEREEFDLVAVGRALLIDPQWGRKLREGRFEEMVAYDKSAMATLS